MSLGWISNSDWLFRAPRWRLMVLPYWEFVTRRWRICSANRLKYRIYGPSCCSFSQWYSQTCTYVTAQYIAVTLQYYGHQTNSGKWCLIFTVKLPCTSQSPVCNGSCHPLGLQIPLFTCIKWSPIRIRIKLCAL